MAGQPITTLPPPEIRVKSLLFPCLICFLGPAAVRETFVTLKLNWGFEVIFYKEATGTSHLQSGLGDRKSVVCRWNSFIVSSGYTCLCVRDKPYHDVMTVRLGEYETTRILLFKKVMRSEDVHDLARKSTSFGYLRHLDNKNILTKKGIFLNAVWCFVRNTTLKKVESSCFSFLTQSGIGKPWIPVSTWLSLLPAGYKKHLLPKTEQLEQ